MMWKMNILSKNYKWIISKIYIMFPFRKKLIRFSVPYWIQVSEIDKELLYILTRNRNNFGRKN